MIIIYIYNYIYTERERELIVEFQCCFPNQNIPSKVVFSQDLILYLRGAGVFKTILATQTQIRDCYPVEWLMRLIDIDWQGQPDHLGDLLLKFSPTPHGSVWKGGIPRYTYKIAIE